MQLQEIEKIIKKASKEINETNICEIGKPAQYYIAYKTYTSAYWAKEIERIFSESASEQQEKITALLEQYGLNPIYKEKLSYQFNS